MYASPQFAFGWKPTCLPLRTPLTENELACAGVHWHRGPNGLPMDHAAAQMGKEMSYSWLTEVDSSNIEGYAYNATTAVLVVGFKKGTFYRYNSVPPEIFQGLEAADSKGGFFSASIRNAFACEEVTEEVAIQLVMVTPTPRRRPTITREQVQLYEPMGSLVF